MRRLLTSIGIAALVISACGGDESGEPAPSLSPEADVGRRLVQTNGCAACHGSSGGGGVGPPLAGAYGREVRLEDGTTTIADEEYLRRSIREPGAQIVEGYKVPMPTVNLSDEEIDSIIAYIRELSAEAGG